MKTIKNIFLTITSIFLLTLFAFPQTILAQSADTEKDKEIEEILNSINDERTQKLETTLGLNLPLVSENPNHSFTFTDPSGKGVYIQIDGKDYVQMENPFSMPTLGIGVHTLNFKFTDKENTQQILDREFIIIPRAPQIKAPDTNSANLTIGGTGLAGSSLELFLTNGIKTYNGETNIDNKGIWSYTFENAMEEGAYTVTAIARKNGYASKFSEPVTFLTGAKASTTDATSTATSTVPFVKFSFSGINTDNIVFIAEQNPDLLITLGVTLLLGLILGNIFAAMTRNSETKKAERLLKTVLTGPHNNSPTSSGTTNGSSTLVDKLKNAGYQPPLQTLSASSQNGLEKQVNSNVPKKSQAEVAQEVTELEVVDSKEIDSRENVVSTESPNDKVEEPKPEKKRWFLQPKPKAAITDTKLTIVSESEVKPEKPERKGLFSFLKRKPKQEAKTENSLASKLAARKVEVLPSQDRQLPQDLFEKTELKSEVGAGNQVKSSKKSKRKKNRGKQPPQNGVVASSEQEPKSFSKDDFLMKFKDFDPDDDSGHEVKEGEHTKSETNTKSNLSESSTKPVKRNISITLSSGQNLD